MSRIPRRHVLAASLLALSAGPLALPATGSAATTVSIKGAGFGHGVGMSQWGAKGLADHGSSAVDILTHYYTGTQVSSLASSPDVRVLLASRTSVTFSGATLIGSRALVASQSYSARVQGASVVLSSSSGDDLVRFDGPVAIAAGGAPVTVAGSTAAGVTNGAYRGAIELRPSAGKLLVINQLGLEDYVRGVVASESPASWPAAALQAQAVAARTYAITTDAGGDVFSQWSDTRSQVYRGVAGETATTDAAVRATDSRVVTYGGTPVTTFFFSTSGGRTENNESSFLGAAPSPWLRSVDDPYDAESPRHTWSKVLTTAQMKAKLGSLVKGSYRSIRVTQRGASPRIVSAQVIGSAGQTTVSGPTLRAKLGLDDTWASFRTVRTTVSRTRRAPAAVRAASLRAAADAGPSAFGATISGRIDPASAGRRVTVQRRSLLGSWKAVAITTTRAGGTYETLLPGPGTYRIAYRGTHGPAVDAA